MSIVRIGDPILSQKATLVTDVSDRNVQDLIKKMFTTMHQERGVGLAAPQVNVALQIAVIKTDETKLVLINPIITQAADELVVCTEGCLSVPGKELPIIRHKEIVVSYLDENNKKNTIRANDFLAIVCQHEIDHLHGILMTDRYAQQQDLRKTLNITEKYE